MTKLDCLNVSLHLPVSNGLIPQSNLVAASTTKVLNKVITKDL